MATAIADLVLRFGADIAEVRVATDLIQRSLTDLSTKAESTMGKLYGSIKNVAGAYLSWQGAKMFAGMIESTIEAQAALHDLSLKTGATVEGLSQLANVGKLSGTSAEAISGAMTRMARTLAQGNIETNKAAVAFKTLGITIHDANGNLLPTEQILKNTAQVMSGYSNGLAKTQLLQTLLGRSGAQLAPLLNDLANNTDILATTTKEVAERSEYLTKQWARLGLEADQMKSKFATSLMEPLLALSQALLDVVKGTNNARAAVNYLSEYGSFEDWATISVRFLALVVDGFIALGKGIAASVVNISLVGNSIKAIALGLAALSRVIMDPFLNKEGTQRALNDLRATLDTNNRLFALSTKLTADILTGGNLSVSQALDKRLELIRKSNAAMLAAAQNASNEAMRKAPIGGKGGVTTFDMALAEGESPDAARRRIEARQAEIDAAKRNATALANEAKTLEASFFKMADASQQNIAAMQDLAAGTEPATNAINKLDEAMKTDSWKGFSAGTKESITAAALLASEMQRQERQQKAVTDAVMAANGALDSSQVALNEARDSVGLHSTALGVLEKLENSPVWKTFDDKLKQQLIDTLQLADSNNQLADALNTVTAIEMRAAALKEAGSGKYVSLIATLKKLQLVYDSTDMSLEQFTQDQLAALKLDPGTQQLERNIEAMREETEALGKSTAQRELDNIAREKTELFAAKLPPLLEASRLAMLEEAEATIRAKDAKERWLASQENIANAIQKVADYGQTFFESWAEGMQGVSDWCKRVGQDLKKWLLDVLYELTVKRWVIQIAASIFGLNNNALASMLGGATPNADIFSLLMGGKSLLGGGNLFSTGATGISSGLLSGSVNAPLGSAESSLFGSATGLETVSNAAGSGFFPSFTTGLKTLSTAFTQGVSAVGGWSSALTAGLQVIGPIAAVAALAVSLFSKKRGGPMTREYGLSPGATLEDFSEAAATHKLIGTDAVITQAYTDLTNAQNERYAAMLKQLGGKGTAKFFVYSSQDPRGTAPSGVHAEAKVGGKSAYNIDTGLTIPHGDAQAVADRLALESERAIFAALQASDLPAVVAKMFNKFTASTMSAAGLEAIETFGAAVAQLVDKIQKQQEKARKEANAAIAKASTSAAAVIKEQSLTESLTELGEKAADAVAKTGETLSITSGELGAAIGTSVSSLPDAVKSVDKAAAEASTALDGSVSSIGSGIAEAVAEAGSSLTAAVDTIAGDLSDAVGDAASDLPKLTEDLTDAVEDVAVELPEIVQMLLDAVDGTEAQLTQLSAILPAVTAFVEILAADPLADAEALLEMETTSLTTALDDAGTALQDVIDNFDGSAEASTSMANALGVFYVAAVQMIAGLLKAQQSIDDSIAATKRNIETTGMTPEQKTGYLQDENERYRTSMLEATDPERIKYYADKINANINEAWNLLSPEAQQAQQGTYLSQLAVFNKDVDQHIQDVISKTEEKQQSFMNQLEPLLTAAVQGFLDASDTQKKAASDNLDAANTPLIVKVQYPPLVYNETGGK